MTHFPYPDEPIFIWALHYLSVVYSFPVYTIAFFVLFFKCPSYFKTYRRYLIVHISSGILLEIHMSVFWKVLYPLPIPALCSTGLTANRPAPNFIIFIYLLIYTAISGLSLLVYRMKAATPYADNSRFAKIPIYLRHVFHVGLFSAFCSSIAVYSYLVDQKEYKKRLEQKSGKFPNFIWNENCNFMEFDSKLFFFFYSICYFSMVWGFSSGIFAVVVTLKSLNCKSMRLSAKTILIQKNVMYSLVAAVIVHVILLFIPLAYYFLSNIVYLDTPILAHLLVLMIQEHGSCSTLTLILTNNLLRKSFKDLFTSSFGSQKQQKQNYRCQVAPVNAGSDF